MDFWIWFVCGIILIFGLVVARGAPYVPSHRRYAKKALTELYPLSDKDVLVDLGSGDGLVLRLAASLGAKTIGYELNPILVGISQLLSWGNPKITTKVADYWAVALPLETTVVYGFFVTRDVAKVQKKLQKTVNGSGRPLWLITYGAKLKEKEPTKILDAHSLYLFEPEPLQGR